jgi:phosphoribosylamine--glycine ligase
MKVLIVGGGGREHALAWKVSRSPKVDRVYVAPGNAGTAREPKVENLAIGAEDIDALCRFARGKAIDLTIIGPEAPLASGVVDAFEEAGLRCFGPRKNAAILEGSKSFSKDFMKRHGIPTAAYESFVEVNEAIAYIRAQGAPLVVKASGLAAGKGVVIAHEVETAVRAAQEMLSGTTFGAAGREVVIEEFLQGEEASFIVVTDGIHILPLASSQDHKARDEGDTGPNTGGMGAYSPAPVVTPEVHDRVLREVILPTVRGMAAEGRPYRGFLYAGIMIAPDGTSKVLEYNCRLGDPETQPILMRLKSDFVEILNATLDGRLAEVHPQWDPRAALGVVLTAHGYPGDYRKGDPISGLNGETPDIKVFHAGTSLHEGEIVTSGGRVLCVSALGKTVAEAQRRAYERVGTIHWEGMYFRRDIGHRAVARHPDCPLFPDTEA